MRTARRTSAAEVDAVNRLQEALEAEERAITARDTDAMERFVTVKQELLNELEACHRKHAQLLADAGLTDDRNGLAAAVERCGGEAGDVSAVWADLQEALVQCQRRNQVNGRLLASTQHHTQRALAILMGGPSDGGELYSPDGKSAPTGRSLGRGVKA